MSLSVKDFLQMIHDEIKAGGFTRKSGVMRRLRKAFGCFLSIRGENAERELTAEGLDEYTAVQAWLKSGAKRALKLVHPVPPTHKRKSAHRPVALYVRHSNTGPRRKTRRTAPPASVQKVLNRAVGFPRASDQLKKLKQSTVALYLRKALMDIAVRSTTDKPTRSYISEVLDACHDDLRDMLND